ncbi:phage major capsid protein [Micromonospora sp. NPDC007271]|uniref:phage major capsid protein n=1 Tax=Micromonospora sp. NPDC007271 TaxID=3154587 RepID=UPI0033F65AA8
MDYENRCGAIASMFDDMRRERRDFRVGEIADLMALVKDTPFSEPMLRAVNLSGNERVIAVGEVGKEMRQFADAERAEAENRAGAEAAEVRALNEQGARLSSMRGEAKPDAAEWRNLFPTRDELRTLQEGVNADGGYTVPKKVSAQYLDLLRAKSVFLGAPGLNVLPMDSKELQLPQLTGTTGVEGPTDEGQVIADNDITFSGPILTAYGYKALTKATAEIMDDSALPLRQVIIDTLTRDIAQRIDLDYFGSATTGRLAGLTATGNNTKTALAAGKKVVTWADVITAVSNIEGAGGRATVIFASPDMAAALRSERENGTTGAFLAGNVTDAPTTQAQGLPLLVSANIPVRSVLVCDMSRVFVGARSVKLNVSEQAYFAQDMIGVRLVHRIGGAVVAEPVSVQWIQAAAS